MSTPITVNGVPKEIEGRLSFEDIARLAGFTPEPTLVVICLGKRVGFRLEPGDNLTMEEGMTVTVTTLDS